MNRNRERKTVESRSEKEDKFDINEYIDREEIIRTRQGVFIQPWLGAEFKKNEKTEGTDK